MRKLKILGPAKFNYLNMLFLAAIFLSFTVATGDTRATSPPAVFVSDDETHWSLKPLVCPEVPTFESESTDGDENSGDIANGSEVNNDAKTAAVLNPIDAFLKQTYRQYGLAPLPKANKLTLLRRVSIDLTGLPPTPSEQQSFLNDVSETAYESAVQRLLESPQHGVRYARHWLDVLRYIDIDGNSGSLGGNIPAGENLYLWRDWMITALNEDIPYDEFVRAQITGYRDAERTSISATGFRRRNRPRPDDAFALGFLSRGANNFGDADEALALNAVETVSTAFMGMTVGCAKCHDHFYDPISQDDFYSMKALFDPLVLEPVQMATANEILNYGQQQTVYDRDRKKLEREIDELTKTYHDQLYDERVAMLPNEIQLIIRKPAKERNEAEQKTADEYYPVLRIDSGKLREIMPADVAKTFSRLEKERNSLRRPASLPVFWTVAEDEVRKQKPHYILNSGDAERPQTDNPVTAGFPFVDSDDVDFSEGLREGFVDWLTADENPLFARVAVNRIWQWHFGTGLHQRASDYGILGGTPIHPELLDWLAAEFIANQYSMKWLHHAIVTSEAYQRASALKKTDHDSISNVSNNNGSTSPSQVVKTDLKECSTESDSKNKQIDPANQYFWKFPIRRADAETIWDAIHLAADDLDLTVGGPSFVPKNNREFLEQIKRRGIYLQRGFRAGEEVMPEFLRVFDVEDGRTPCPRRGQTITAPQNLLLLNSPLVDQATEDFARRVVDPSEADLSAAVERAYRATLCRPPTEAESNTALSFLNGDAEKMQEFCWLLFNLDEFVFIP